MIGIHIEPSRAVRADVVRRFATVNEVGALVDETFAQTIRPHWVDLQPLTNGDIWAMDQMKFRATNKIYPEINLGEKVKVGDFYRISNKLYRVTAPKRYTTITYFYVLHDTFGQVQEQSDVAPVSFAFMAQNVPAGSHTFGSGLFASIKPFSSTPAVIPVASSDASFYVPTVTATGFTLVDRLSGHDLYVNVIVMDTSALGIKSIVQNVGPGQHTFGQGSFSGVLPFSIAPAVIGVAQNDSSFYVPNVTVSGLTIVDRLEGQEPLVRIHLWDMGDTALGRWLVHGLTEGAYTFGQGAFASVPLMGSVPYVMPLDGADGSYYMPALSGSGFSLVEREGSISVSALVIRRN